MIIPLLEQFINKYFIVRYFTISLLLTSLLFGTLSFAQSGEKHTYKFLTLPNSARIAGLGGNFATINDNDINVAVANPSLINAEMHNNLGMSFVDYHADLNYGYATYGRSFKKVGNFVGTMQFIDYGTFDFTNENGDIQGNFTAGEYAMNIGWGRSLDSSFSIGANLKGIYSSLESYNSFGLAVDVAGTYHNADHKFTASLIFSNIGRQITTYNGFNETLPFEIKAGLSKTLQHIPLTFSVLFTNLQKWDLTYPDNNSNSGSFNGEEPSNSGVADFGDKLMRHIVIGAELRPFKVIRLRLGYNYLRRQEMVLDTKPGTVGWSWGLGIKVYKFEVAYSRSAQYLGPSFNFFSLTTNLDSFFHTIE